MLSKLSQKHDLAPSYHSLIKEELSPFVSQKFGYYSLLYTPLAKSLVEEDLVIKNQFVINRKKEKVDLVCSFEELPIASDTIDLAVLPNILQSAENPHQILREVERVLIPEGTLIVVGRNPFSWKGILARYQQWRSDRQSAVRDISRGRICDWFRLLGFETEQLISVSRNNHRLQKSQFYLWVKKLSSIHCDIFGSYYIIIARKKVSTLTPIRQSWRRNKQMVPSRIAEPSVRSQVENWFQRLGKNSD